MEPPSQKPPLLPGPDKNGGDDPAEVKSPPRPEARRESPDGPKKDINWQFIGTVVAIIGLCVVIFFGFLELRNACKTTEQLRETTEQLRKIVYNTTAAALLQQKGENQKAIEKWRDIVDTVGEEDNQLRARAWFLIGYLQDGEERTEAAMDAYTKAIVLNSDFTEAYNNRGVAKNILGHHQDALADYNRAIALNPDYAVAYHNRGSVKDILGQYEAAIADYNRAIALSPAYAEAYNGRGTAKKSLRPDLEGFQDAIADYDQAIALNPDYYVAYANRGVAKKNLGRINEARADYQKAIALAQAAGNADFVKGVKRNLGRLDNKEGA